MSHELLSVQNHVETFYPNVCHVCKTRAENEENEVICKCKMIRYCSDDHQKEHAVEHADICEIFQEMIAHKELDIYPRYISNVEWFQMKNELLSQVNIRLQRQAKSYEIHMILFPRSCVYCHARDNLMDCPYCPVTSYCLKHREQFLVLHKDLCSNFEFCFELDVFEPTKLEDTGIKIDYLGEVTDNAEINMSKFLNIFVAPRIPRNSVFSIRQICLQSEYLTRPLTFFFGLTKLETPVTQYLHLNVHVLAENLGHINTESSWEILLHLMPNLISLNITIFYQSEYQHREIDIGLCEECMKKSKTIKIAYSRLTCSQHASGRKENHYPSIIVRFTSGMYIQDSSKHYFDNVLDYKNLNAIAQYHCPFILLSLSERHAEREHDTFTRELLSSSIIFKGINPCLSTRPYRDFDSEVIYFDNLFITVYNALHCRSIIV